MLRIDSCDYTIKIFTAALPVEQRYQCWIKPHKSSLLGHTHQFQAIAPAAPAVAEIPPCQPWACLPFPWQLRPDSALRARTQSAPSKKGRPNLVIDGELARFKEQLQTQICNLTVKNVIPYSAYISQVSNLTNFVNLESFAKLIQRKFDSLQFFSTNSFKTAIRENLDPRNISATWY